MLVGCATITKGTTQTIAVDTPGVAGAQCTIQTQSGPRVVTTPSTVTLNKGSAPLPITCTKECYVLASSIIPSNTETMAAGNVLLGGVIGLGVDAASDAMNKYPDVVTVAHVTRPRMRRAAAAASDELECNGFSEQPHLGPIPVPASIPIGCGPTEGYSLRLRELDQVFPAACGNASAVKLERSSERNPSGNVIPGAVYQD